MYQYEHKAVEAFFTVEVHGKSVQIHQTYSAHLLSSADKFTRAWALRFYRMLTQLDQNITTAGVCFWDEDNQVGYIVYKGSTTRKVFKLPRWAKRVE